MQNRPLGPFSVANVALGCMNFCHAYGNPVSTEQSHAVLHAALDAGVTQFDTAALYGFGASESLVGPVLQPHRDRITLASKGGMAGVRGDGGGVGGGNVGCGGGAGGEGGWGGGGKGGGRGPRPAWRQLGCRLFQASSIRLRPALLA